MCRSTFLVCKLKFTLNFSFIIKLIHVHLAIFPQERKENHLMEERRILREDLEQYHQQCQEITEKLNDALEDNASLTLRLNEVYNMAELFNMNICLLFLK